ncbi:penicillin-binding protein [Sebaldella termitidis]|uniref:penicillin-binding protein n=1 Tax=Sebaldella termitidis TaxID=826 RepID=UPI003EC00811
MKRKYSFKGRFIIVCMFFFFSFLFLLLILFKIQVMEGRRWSEVGYRQYYSEVITKAKRGSIITTDGQDIAYDVEAYQIILDPTLIKAENIDKVSSIISSEVKEIKFETLKKEINDKKRLSRKYLKVGEPIDYNMKNRMNSELAKEAGLKFGVFFETIYKRKDPGKELYGPVIGFLNSEGKGVYGLEKYYEDTLEGTNGVIATYRATYRDFELPTAKRRAEKKYAEDGKNLVLTIDSVLQYTLDEELKKAYLEFDAKTATGIIMESDTGKIIAMSSYPKAKDNSEIKNNNISDLFEPGSIFKPLIVAEGLQEGVINKNSIINSSGQIQVKDRIIKDHDASTIGDLTLEKIISLSGNVAMVKIAERIKDETFYEYLKKFGLDSKTGIDLYSETAIRVQPPSKWDGVKKANMSFGQGISMTQIQIITALNTIVNDGKRVRPYVVDKVIDENGKVLELTKPVVEEVVFSPDVAREVRRIMESVVDKGTGRGTRIEGYKIGGKTGTAQKAGSRGYAGGGYVSSFFAFFPVDNPKYTILVTIDEPKGQYYGAQVALPTVKAMIEKIIKYKGIKPNGEENIIVNLNVGDDNKTKPQNHQDLENSLLSGVMPDFTGLSLREVLMILPADMYPNYKLSGSGRVKSQSPAKGSKIDGKTKIVINLE